METGGVNSTEDRVSIFREWLGLPNLTEIIIQIQQIPFREWGGRMIYQNQRTVMLVDNDTKRPATEKEIQIIEKVAERMSGKMTAEYEIVKENPRVLLN